MHRLLPRSASWVLVITDNRAHPYLLSSHHTLEQSVPEWRCCPLQPFLPALSGSPGRDDDRMAVDGQVQNCSAPKFPPLNPHYHRHPSHTTTEAVSILPLLLEAYRLSSSPGVGLSTERYLRQYLAQNLSNNIRWSPQLFRRVSVSSVSPTFILFYYSGTNRKQPIDQYKYNTIALFHPPRTLRITILHFQPSDLDRTRRSSRFDPRQPTHSYHYKYSLRSPSALSGTSLFLSFSAVTTPP